MPVSTVKTLGLLGTGVIGAGWAARALHFGINVIATDSKPGMEAWLRSAITNAEPALERLIAAPLPPRGQLSYTCDVGQMARAADFIQENIPEQLELKQRVLADISRQARPEIIIASSTSGLMPTRSAARRCKRRKDSASPIRLIRSTCCRWSKWWAAS